MSAFASPTDVANLALAEIGAKRIQDLESDSSTEAVACRLHFEHCRNTLLRRHPWSFAEKSQELTQDANPPANDAEWDAAWILPVDFIRLIRIPGDGPNAPRDRFGLSGKRLLTRGLDEVHLVYITNETPVPEWDDLFVDALRFKLASEIAEDLTGSPQRADSALTKLEQLALPDAALADAQEVASGENRTPAMQAAQSALVQSRYARNGQNITTTL